MICFEFCQQTVVVAVVTNVSSAELLNLNLNLCFESLIELRASDTFSGNDLNSLARLSSPESGL